jgi:hypothetical protein
VSIEITWNAGRSATGRKITNVLFGASWSHHPGWPQRTTHLYLGLWVLTLRTKTKR